MSGSIIDIVVLVLIVVFAINGYRQGFLVGLLSFAGFFAGALLGLQLGPMLANHVSSDTGRVMASLLGIFGCAIAGQALTGLLGTRLRGAIQSRAGRRADDVAGALVSVFTVLLVVWLVAVPLASSSLPGLAKAVRSSAILGNLDRVMPEQAKTLSEALRETVDTRGFPDVFSGLSPTKVTNVPAPDPALAGSPVVQAARKSVVKVRGTAPSCSRSIEGSGFVYETDRVMTNAHVVAGTRSVSVEVNGNRHSAKVVAYDPGRDLAVLYSPNLGAPVMPFDKKVAPSGTDSIVVGFPLDGPFDVQPARVRDERPIEGPNIYDSGKVTRQIYTLRAWVRSGNSGGPLLSTSGAVIGVIFAAAADDQQTGFALTAQEAAPVVAAAAGRTDATNTQGCA